MEMEPVTTTYGSHSIKEMIKMIVKPDDKNNVFIKNNFKVSFSGQLSPSKLHS